MRVSWSQQAWPTVPAPAPARARRVLHRLGGTTMGTTWSVSLAGPAHWLTAALQLAAQRALDQVVDQMSNWKSDSAIGRFNTAEAGSWHALPAETVVVIEAALALARSTGGACDPTIGPLVDLWGFGPSRRRASMPSTADVDEVLARTGWRRLERDDQGRFLQPGGLGIDLCGIAKGFAVDQVMTAMDDAGVTDCLVEVGGELRARGRRPDGHPWRIAVESPSRLTNRATSASAHAAGSLSRQAAPLSPRLEQESPLVPLAPLPPPSSMPSTQAAIVELHDMAVATSGDRWHFFEHDGRRMSHTLDPRTGRPVADDLASVTVLHRECMQADALATALTVLGPVAGMDYALGHGLAVMMARRSRDGATEIQMSPAFEAALHASCMATSTSRIAALSAAEAGPETGTGTGTAPPTAVHAASAIDPHSVAPIRGPALSRSAP
ncbi:MAG: hypothetical protein JWQ11_1705 [Rhizobacter sp.]|nr:hypothetical protein [Rhizobacter sp.]